MSGTLYVVATPIGNLDDLTPRARQTLADVDLIAAEDTRHTGRLLSHFGIKTPLFVLHDHNEEAVVSRLLPRLLDGQSIALVSDAGTPLISDPGYRLVCASQAEGIRVSPIPGACAATAALSVAGLPTDRYVFEGFLSPRKKARHDRLEALAGEGRTMVFYESVHRVAACVEDMATVFGADRPAFVGRELTKLHEETVQSSLGELRNRLNREEMVPKGEFVIVVGGADTTGAPSMDVDRLLVDLADKLPAKDVAKILARATGAKRNALYARLLELRHDNVGE